MEGFACHIKKEQIASYDECNKKVMILINEKPFPGYFSCYPHDTSHVPHMFYIPLKPGSGCVEDKIWRINIELKKENVNCFEATYGHLILFNKETPCIRLDMVDKTGTDNIIERFEKEGVKFQKCKKVESYDSIINVRRFLELQSFLPDVYKEEKEHFYYIEVPGKLKWKNFTEMILSIKGERKFKSFDAAQTSLYRKNEVREFIRIYTTSFEEVDFIELRNELQTQMVEYCDNM